PSDDPAGPAGGPRRWPLVVQKGGQAVPFLFKHQLAIRSLPEIAQTARSEASIGTEIDEGGTVRSVPLVSMIGGNLVPALAVELLRLAARAPSTVVTSGPGGIVKVSVGDIDMPTDGRGRAYLHFQ